jgi:hypothetical protein
MCNYFPFWAACYLRSTASLFMIQSFETGFNSIWLTLLHIAFGFPENYEARISSQHRRAVPHS